MKGCALDPLFELGETTVVVPVSVIGDLPECFEETILGEPRLSLRQFRCYHGYHVRDYGRFYEIHMDNFDPRLNPGLHLIFDTEIVGMLALALASRLRKKG